MNENNEQIEVKENQKKYKKFYKKWWFWTAVSILTVALITGIVIFLIYKVPYKYCGTYVQYAYFDGNEYKGTFKISPLSIKVIKEGIRDGKYTIEETKLKYSKKGKDLIVKEENSEKYIIIEDDCLYVESNKDISTSKKYGNFYWNEKSDKADLYKIENKSEELEDLLEKTMNTWTRELIYETANQEMDNSSFYIIKSEKETDKTDLNTYQINYNASGGELSLYYNRKTEQLSRIYYSGNISSSLYSFSTLDSMDIADIYDSKAMLLSFMYILGNKDNIELNQDIEDTNHISKSLKDTFYRSKVAEEYDELFNNIKVDKTYDDEYTYSLDNDKYSINYTSWITEGVYSVSGIVSFSISLK